MRSVTINLDDLLCVGEMWQQGMLGRCGPQTCRACMSAKHSGKTRKTYKIYAVSIQ